MKENVSGFPDSINIKMYKHESAPSRKLIIERNN